MGLFSCGGTSETGNARVASISGSILVNDCDTTTVWVHLVNEHYFPVADTSGMVYKVAVDPQGDYNFQSIPWNNYYLYIKGSDQNVLRGPITITVPEVELGKDTLHYTSVVTVYTPDTASYNFIFIKGIPELFKISSGYTTLYEVPAGRIEIISGNSNDNYSNPFDSGNVKAKIVLDVTQFDTLNIGFNNSAPVFDSSKIMSQRFFLDCSQIYQDTLFASDPDSDLFYYYLYSKPEGMICDSSTGVITWTVPDSIVNSTITFTSFAKDTRGASGTFRWSVGFRDTCSISQVLPLVVITPLRVLQSDTVKADFYNCHCSNSSSPDIMISWGNGDTIAYSTSETVRYAGFHENGIYFVTGKLICAQQLENEWFNIDSITVSDKYQQDTVILYGQNPVILENGTLFIDPGAVVITADFDSIKNQIVKSGTVDYYTNGKYFLHYSYIPHEGDTLMATRAVFVVSQDSTLPRFALQAVDTIWNDSSLSITFSAESLLMVADTPYVRFSRNQAQPSEWTHSMSISCPATAVDTPLIAIQYLNPVTFTYSNWFEIYSCNHSNDITGKNIRITTFFDTLHPGEQLFLVIQGSICNGDTVAMAHVDWGDDFTDDTFSTHIFQHTWNNSGTYTISTTLMCPSSSGADTVYTNIVCVLSHSLTDSVPPTIILSGHTTDSIFLRTSYIDSGATAMDPEQGNLTGSIQKYGNVDVNTPGEYFIIYFVRDSSGNRASAIRKVIVL
jgi:hypothetical protein